MNEPSASAGSLRDIPLSAFEEVLRVVPKFVERTRSQAELARALAGYVPCLGAFVGGREPETPPAEPEHEDVDVLTAFSHDGPELTVVGTDPAETLVDVEQLLESEMPIQDYDSLAASQVVPRLATLGHEQLRAVRSYELANRSRQTILNRVAQLLSE